MKRTFLIAIVSFLRLFSLLHAEEGFILRLNDEERAIIYEIISEMGERSLIGLFFKQIHMNRLGDSVRHVPPLQFLGYVLSDGHLRSSLKKVSHHPIKWSYFIDGFGKNMEYEIERGRVFQELGGFAILADRSSEKLMQYALERAWDSFVRETL